MKTCKISVYVMEKQINEIIEFLHKSEIMEITDTKSGGREKISDIENELKRADKAIDVANRYKPIKSGFFRKRKKAAHTDYDMDKKQTEAARGAIAQILKACSELEENNDELGRINLKLAQLEEYKSLEVPLSGIKTEYTKAIAGSCRSVDSEELSEKISQSGIRLFCEEIKRTGRDMLIWCVYFKEDEAKTFEFLGELEFSATEINSQTTPKEEISRLMAVKKELEERNDGLIKKICSAAKCRRNIELYYDRLLLKKEKAEALENAASTEKTYILTGYVPREHVDRIAGALKSRGCAVMHEEPEEGEMLPVAFRNNAFVSPVEEITASYSMPSKHDIDPNPVMSVFYYWFFGMMFSDAGYGLLMMLVCGVLGFSQLLERERRKMFKMFFACGVSTTLWGIAYGSFFGDLIGTVSKTFGNGKTEFLPVLIDPVNQALELLIISVAFGMVHILTALVIKFRNEWSMGNKSGAVYDVGSWIAVLAGLSVFAAGSAIGWQVAANLGLGISIVGAALRVATGGRDKKSPVMRIFLGILSLYDITTFVGDILSYSRLMALGLATGVIASVVNVLGSLGGNSPVGVIMFVLISIFGHTLNFAINMLGAYVHTNRLQYVEFYQKFYEGGGRRFKPFRLETKYFDFSDSRNF
ncbi:MAG: V-type ATP synthase subunit I [Clostridia bacterium]|nr:V-type ATP synthase subunit I [Clostridia bacterium]